MTNILSVLLCLGADDAANLNHYLLAIINTFKKKAKIIISTEVELSSSLQKYAIIKVNKDYNLGKRKQRLLSQAKTEWVLVLDVDERVSTKLAKEITTIINEQHSKYNGYRIPVCNHFGDKLLKEQAEQYTKLIFFRRNYGHINPALVHENVTVIGPVGKLTSPILHYSYRTIPQVVRKFTNYARRAATEKIKKKERMTFSKLFLYGPHMFWARFFKSGGYKDGWHGFILSLLFAYMESLTYILLFVRNIWQPANQRRRT